MIEPVIHRILVKPDDLSDFDPARKRAKELGFEIPEMDDTKRQKASVDRGIVIKVGPTAFRDFNTECPVKEGDWVAYARQAGKPITDPFTKEDFVLLNDEDIVCIFKEE